MMAAAIDEPDARPGTVAVIDLRLIPQPASTGMGLSFLPVVKTTLPGVPDMTTQGLL